MSEEIHHREKEICIATSLSMPWGAEQVRVHGIRPADMERRDKYLREGGISHCSFFFFARDHTGPLLLESAYPLLACLPLIFSCGICCRRRRRRCCCCWTSSAMLSALLHPRIHRQRSNLALPSSELNSPVLDRHDYQSFGEEEECENQSSSAEYEDSEPGHSTTLLPIFAADLGMHINGYMMYPKQSLQELIGSDSQSQYESTTSFTP
jgi:hypothetical protein